MIMRTPEVFAVQQYKQKCSLPANATYTIPLFPFTIVLIVCETIQIVCDDIKA